MRGSSYVHRWRIAARSRKLGAPSLLVVGVSSAGKHSLARALVESWPSLVTQLGPTTTRPCDIEEVNIDRYEFVSIKQFEKLRLQGRFLYWHHTERGSFGLDKLRLREATSSYSACLMTFRSFGAAALKLAMPPTLVFELRVSLPSLEARRKLRERRARDPLVQRVEDRADLQTNRLLYDLYGRGKKPSWFRLQNDLHEPPIQRGVVIAAQELMHQRFSELRYKGEC